MNLWLVTFELDYTQFVVDAKTIDDVIEKAIMANESAYLGGWDEEEISKDEMENHTNYSAEIIDMDLLGEIMKRNDYVGNYCGVLIFSN